MEKITEANVILKHTSRMLSETSWTKNKFLSERIVPALLEAGHFDGHPGDMNGDAYIKWIESKRRSVQYIMDGKHNFPIKYKWPWIHCLLLDYQEACKRDLLAMHGTLYVPLPEATSERMPADSRIFELTKEFADVQAASRPAQDGAYSALDDVNEVQHLADQLLELVEAAQCELRRLEMGTGISPTRMQILRSVQPPADTE